MTLIVLFRRRLCPGRWRLAEIWRPRSASCQPTVDLATLEQTPSCNNNKLKRKQTQPTFVWPAGPNDNYYVIQYNVLRVAFTAAARFSYYSR